MKTRATDSGLTLAELVVVVLIIAILAGLVVTITSGSLDYAEYAATAVHQERIREGFSGYYLANGYWPDRLDSLLRLDPASLKWVSYSSLRADLAAPKDPPSPDDRFAISTLTAGQLRSINLAGLKVVMDHLLFQEVAPPATPPETPSDSGLQPRALAISGRYVRVDEATLLGNRLYREVFPHAFDTPPDPDPAAVRLGVFGLGPESTAFRLIPGGSTKPTMERVPMAPERLSEHKGRYSRFLAVYAIFEDGRKAQLMGILDPSGATAAENRRKADGR